MADKRLVSVFFLVVKHTEYGRAVAAIFRALRLPDTYACVLSFLWCELRKYFKPLAGDMKYRAGWADAKDRSELLTACQKKGNVLRDWCHADDLAGSFITPNSLATSLSV
jgi:hypothetical protein